MAQTNYTPIQLYYSTTAAAVPVNTNLLNGELAINITDGKLYYKDNSGTVQVIATKGAGTIGGSTTQIQYNNAGALAGSSAMTFNNSTNVVTLTTLNLTNALGAIYGGTGLSTYTTGDLLYSSASNTLAKLAIGTANYILTVNSGGTNVQWSAPSSISVSTATNLAGGVAGSVPYQSGASTTTFLGIGAADRVMTSSGSAPQWVTALTGLTGVSSSSITNTSLTSGRVVFSGASGVQSDSANLTFDGTTLTTAGLSNSGTSALVKLVTVGGTSFNGTTVFAAATPAKLYMGTGTATDTTSAIGATNAVGAVASLAITPIAATNTSVTYTDAATLYIAGAPSAGTNITLTNPYALYIAAGNVYLGGGTANGVAYLNGSKVLTTGSALVFDGTNLSVGTTALSGGKFSTLADLTLVNGLVIRDSATTYANNDNYLLLQNSTGATAGGLTHPASGSLGVWGNDDIRFLQSASATDLMRLNSTGLGIGTTTPSVKLDVAGNATIQNGVLTIGKDTVYDAFINTPESMYFNVDSDGNSTGNRFVWGTDRTGTSGGTEWMRIDSSGNLGLGVTPSSQYSTVKAFQVGALGATIVTGQTVAGGTSSFGQNWYVDPTTANYFYAAASSQPATRYSQSAGQHQWFYASAGTAGNNITFTQAMTLDASGNLGIGTTSPVSRIDARAASATMGNYQTIQAFSTDTSAAIDLGGGISLGGFYNSTQFAQFGSIAGRKENGTSGNYAGYLSFGTNSQATGVREVMRLDSSGNLLIGTTGLPVANGTRLSISGSGEVARILGTTTGNPSLALDKSTNDSTTGQVFATFTINNQGAGSGQINANGASQAAFGSFSDRRLKQNIVDLPPQLANIMALRPVEFDYIESEGGGHQTGFIAQEMETIFPDSVGERSDGMKTVTGWNKTEAILIKAIQEQQALITQLTARITALERA